MIPRITAGALAASVFIALCSSPPAGPAAACNRMDGCIHESQLENYGMMRDGRVSEAMRSGADSVEAFRSIGNGGQPTRAASAQVKEAAGCR